MRRAARIAALKKGDAPLQSGGTHFTAALGYAEKAHAFNPDNADLNPKMAFATWNGRYHHRSPPYFRAAYELDNTHPTHPLPPRYGVPAQRPLGRGHAEYQLYRASLKPRTR